MVSGEGKRQFTRLGLPVNLTARFESETKALDTPITMGKDFYDRLPTEPQAMTMQRENRPIRLVRKRCIYTPVHETGEKDKS
jgi:class 3 adenylate cyclase